MARLGFCGGPAGFCGGPAGVLRCDPAGVLRCGPAGFCVIALLRYCVIAVARLAGWVLRRPGGVLGQTRICAFSRKTKRPTGPSLRRLLGARTTANTHTGGCVYRGPLEAHELVRGFWRSHLRLWLVCFFCSGAQGQVPKVIARVCHRSVRFKATSHRCGRRRVVGRLLLLLWRTRDRSQRIIARVCRRSVRFRATAECVRRRIHASPVGVGSGVGSGRRVVSRRSNSTSDSGTVAGATYRARTTAAPLPPHRRRRSALTVNLRLRDSRRAELCAGGTTGCPTGGTRRRQPLPTNAPSPTECVRRRIHASPVGVGSGVGSGRRVVGRRSQSTSDSGTVVGARPDRVCETSDSCEPGWRRQWRRQWKARRQTVLTVNLRFRDSRHRMGWPSV